MELVRNGFQYLLFELPERNGQRVFKPANSGVWWQISASELGSDNVLLAFVVFKGCVHCNAHLSVNLSTVYLPSWLATWLPLSSFNEFNKDFFQQFLFWTFTSQSDSRKERSYFGVACLCMITSNIWGSYPLEYNEYS